MFIVLLDDEWQCVSALQGYEGLPSRAIERAPDDTLGEYINFEKGTIEFDVQRILAALISQIKLRASELILEIAPLSKQLNDMLYPSEEGRVRAALILRVRTWSNELEDSLARSKTPLEVSRIVESLATTTTDFFVKG